MEILDQGADAPSAKVRLDYGKIAEAYNSLQVGQMLKLDPVYNITAFRRSLERRLDKANFEAFHRGGHCFLKRKSTTPMEVV